MTSINHEAPRGYILNR